MEDKKNEEIRDVVRREYGKIAREGSSCCGASNECGKPSVEELALSFGYSAKELANIPSGANLGLSCGNPNAMASVREGETVLDLGSGGGLDVFIAAGRAGASGMAIGVDMTADMIAMARRNLEIFREKSGLHNAGFRLGEIEHLPVADGSVDVVLSNCVINLSPHKEQVWREIARVLKPGGRVSVSDPALVKPLPDEVRMSAGLLAGCISGAVMVEETLEMISEAGLVNPVYQIKSSDFLKEMADWSDPLYRDIAKSLPPGTTPADFVTILEITAEKPQRQSILDDKGIRELVAVGASIGANCKPCLEYHIGKAKDYSMTGEDIKQAIDMGKKVRTGAAYKMDKFIEEFTGTENKENTQCNCATD